MKKTLIISIVFILCLQSVLAASSMTRSLSSTEAMPGDEITVTLSFVEEGSEQSLLLNEVVPEGLEMYEDGKLNDKNNLRKALIDGLTGTVESTDFTYTVKIPAGASGTFTFEGKATMQSGQQDIGGDTTLTVGGAAPPPAPEPVFEAQEPAYEEPEEEYEEPEAYSPPPAAPYVPPAPTPAAAPYTPPPAAPAPYTPPPAEPVYEEESYEEPAAPEPAYEQPAAQPAPSAAPATGQAYEQPSSEEGSSLWMIILLVIGAVVVIGGGIFFAHHQSKNHTPCSMTKSTQFSSGHIKTYIDQYSKLGHSKQQITAHLRNQGIDHKVIDQAHKELESGQAGQQQQPQHKPEHDSHPGHKEAVDPKNPAA